jgi:hypothetical protein
LEPAPGRDRCFNAVGDDLLGPVAGLELDGRDGDDVVAQAPVVAPVDVLGDRNLDIGHRLPAALGAHDWVADALGFEQRVSASAIVFS